MDSYTPILEVVLAPFVVFVAVIGAGLALMLGRRTLAIVLGLVAVAALVAGLLVGSGGNAKQDFIAVPTAPRGAGGGCRLALLAGTLVLHPDWGVAVGGEGEPQLVFWPNGFSAQLTDEGANLRDGQGRVVARTGDQVRGSGGLARFGGREGYMVCASDLQFEPAVP